MSLNGAKIDKGVIGPNRTGADTSISGLLATGVAVATKLALGTTYQIRSVKDAETVLGITPAYDAANQVVLHRHISEFFRMAGEGTLLHLMVAPKTVLPGTLFDNAVYAQKLVIDSNRTIRQLAIAFNPDATYTETLTDGFNSDIRAAIPKAQAFYQWAYDSFGPLQVILEGRAYGGNHTSAIDLRNIQVNSVTLEADKVSLVIGQDWDYAEGLAWASGKKYASVGTALGTVALVAINENIGEVERRNLSNATTGRFVTAGLSNHVTIKDAEAQLATLDTKGYLFPITYVGLSGYRWNGDHVCTPVIVDAQGRMNESTIAYGRTMNEAVRSLRTVLLPKVKTTQKVDPTTGKLPLGVVKYFEGLGDDVFNDMEAKSLISGGKTYVDPASNLLTGAKSLNVAFSLVPTGTVNEINGSINLKTSL